MTIQLHSQNQINASYHKQSVLHRWEKTLSWCGLFPVAGLNLSFIRGVLIHHVAIEEETAVGLFMHHMSDRFRDSDSLLHTSGHRTALLQQPPSAPAFVPIHSVINSIDESTYCYQITSHGKSLNIAR